MKNEDFVVVMDGTLYCGLYINGTIAEANNWTDLCERLFAHQPVKSLTFREVDTDWYYDLDPDILPEKLEDVVFEA